MNIAEIKEQLSDMQRLVYTHIEPDMYESHVKYLLSIIEQAEKALTVFAEDDNWIGRTKYHPASTNGVIQWDGVENPMLLAKFTLKYIQGDEKVLVIEKWTKESDGTITHKIIT